MISRRTFLAASGAALAIPQAGQAGVMTLRAAPVTRQILPAGDGTTALLGFNGMSPGPVLRLRKGETLAVDFENAIGAASAVHWHGIRIDNAMDGVPGMTQDAVEDGETFAYRFRCPDAGTFWYHSHNRSWEQVARGLYGPLIVEETDPPDLDHDIPVVIDDFRLEDSGALAGGFGNMHDFAHAGRLGNFARIFTGTEPVRTGDRLRLRLINTATARSFFVIVQGLDGKRVALDGMPLPEVEPVGDILLAPAQRMDLIGDVTGPVRFAMWTRDGPYELGEIAVAGQNDVARGEIMPLPPADIARPDAPARTLDLRMQGGAMGGAHDGDDIWAFNGVSNLPDAPLARMSRGETIRIRLINDTAFAHGIHLHGHHFHEVAADGSLGALRDTTLVERQESRDILCVFDNPGKWLVHCHMLGHQASGMKTWVEVV